MAMASLETYVGGRSHLHTWTPRLKLVSLALLMFAFATVKHLALIPPMLLVTSIIYGFSELPLSFLLKRLRYPGLFILSVVLILPLTSGDTILAQWGPLAIRQEGLTTMGLVIGRFLSILTLGFVLMGTTPFLTLLRAMRSLGLPTILADMTLLTYRYLFETADMLATMQRSMRLRGFNPATKQSKANRKRTRWFTLDPRTLSQLSGLLGTLLIRSYERSERIYKAMQLRGYGQLQQPQLASQQPIDTPSLALTGLAVIVSIGFLTAEIIFSI